MAAVHGNMTIKDMVQMFSYMLPCFQHILRVFTYDRSLSPMDYALSNDVTIYSVQDCFNNTTRIKIKFQQIPKQEYITHQVW